jgi:hypothetical protein
MEPIDITIRFNIDGQIDPLRFTWKGREYPVTSTGRRWKDEQGEHILIMVPGDIVYEILFIPTEARWYLRQVGPTQPHA